MSWTVLFLVLMVMMGGVIAYIGDNTGRKWGKRRATLFGMRPRHTAILITSVTGVVISLVTAGTLFGLVPPVREVITEGEYALRDYRRLHKNNVTLAAENSALGRLNSTLEAQKKDLESEVRGLKPQVAALNVRLEKVQASLKTAHTELLQAQEERREAVAARETAERQRQQEVHRIVSLRQQNRKLQQDNTTLADINKALAQQNFKQAKDNERLTKDYQSLKQASEEEQKRNQNYQVANEEVARANYNLTRQNEDLLNVNQKLRNESNDLLEKNRTLAEENKALISKNRELESLRIDYPTLEDAYKAMRSRRVVVRGGEDLARRVVPPNATPDVVRSVVQELIHDAGLAAMDKGARPRANAQAVRVVDKQFLQMNSTGTVQTIVEVTGDERVSAVVNRLAWQSTPYCVLALAVANSVEEEPAAIDLQPLPNRLVFPKGRVIGERRFDTSQSTDTLFMEVVSFLKNMGQSTLDLGMIPRIDSETGEPQVGSLNAAEIVSLLDRARAVGRKVRISAIAAADIHVADTLALDFRISPSL